MISYSIGDLLTGKPRRKPSKKRYGKSTFLRPVAYSLYNRSVDLKLWILGPPKVEVGGEPLRVDTRKATALLIYLAERGEAQRRERLATIFWPESDSSHSKAALRRTLSALRKAVGGDWVSADRDTVSVAPPWIDTHEFRRLIASTQDHGHLASEVCGNCIQPLAEAVQLYRDGFLTGFTLPDSPDFDEWQYFTGQSLLGQYSDALSRLIQAFERDQNFESAIDYANRRLALDPLNESAHRDLMRLHARLGQRGLALQQYRDCIRILQQELGAPPLEETVALYEQIKAGDLTPIKPRETLLPDTPTAISRLPLVGREAEFTQIHADYSQIERGTCLIVIEGEAGVGKTRIAEEFIEESPAVALRARCYSDESSIAYRPWIDVLRSSLAAGDSRRKLGRLDNIWLTEAARLLPEIPELFPSIERPTSNVSKRGQDRYMNGLVQVLGALAKDDSPGILFMDDLQWADEASLDLLAYLIRRGPESPLLVIATWRVETAEEEQRLRAWMASMPTDSTRVISLQLLSQDQVQELVTALGSEAPVERLFRETDGLPLFLAEYLAALEAGKVNEKEDQWSLPTQVQEILRSRLASIPGASRQLLSAAAVIGRSFEFEVLRAVSGRAPEETVAGLETLLGAGFVSEYPEQQPHLGPSYDFKHDKFRELALAETTQARQRLLHGRAAEALLHMRGPTSPGAMASRIARHLEAAGKEQQAAELHVEAGDHARNLYANEEAISHYQSALALGFGESRNLHEAVGDLQTLEGNYDLAAQEYETAMAGFSVERTHCQNRAQTGQSVRTLGKARSSSRSLPIRRRND